MPHSAGFQHVPSAQISPASISRELRKKSKTDQKFLQAVGQMRRKCCKVAKKGTLNISKLDRAANVAPHLG